MTSHTAESEESFSGRAETRGMISRSSREKKENTSSHESWGKPGVPEQVMQNLRFVRIVLR